MFYYKLICFLYTVDDLPNSIIYLEFGRDFNQPVDNLPNSIIDLGFGWYFNQPVDNLPNSITYLTFGHNFNQSVDNLPNSIIDLSFGNCFNQSVNNLPCSISYLEFGNYFNQSISNLPNSIEYLIILCSDFNQIIDNLPLSIKYLYICNIEKYLDSDVLKRIKYVFLGNYMYINYPKCKIDDSEDIIFDSIFIYKNKMLGSVIFEELTKYVFNPQRLIRYAEKYDLTFDEYVEFL